MSYDVGPLFVVCIEADDTHRMLIGLSLELDHEMRLQLFATGQDMIESWTDGPKPDAVLINLPLAGGLFRETVEALKRSIGEELPPLIILNSTGSSSCPTTGPLAGVAGVIMKPFDPLTLAEQIRALLAMDDTG